MASASVPERRLGQSNSLALLTVARRAVGSPRSRAAGASSPTRRRSGLSASTSGSRRRFRGTVTVWVPDTTDSVAIGWGNQPGTEFSSRPQIVWPLPGSGTYRMIITLTWHTERAAGTTTYAVPLYSAVAPSDTGSPASIMLPSRRSGFF